MTKKDFEMYINNLQTEFPKDKKLEARLIVIRLINDIELLKEFNSQMRKIKIEQLKNK